MRKLSLLAVMMLMAVSAAAQMDAMAPVVAPDGTVLAIRAGMGAGEQMNVELVAVSRNGTLLWRWQADVAMHSIVADASRVYIGGDEVVALSLQTGAVQWRRPISGATSGIEITGERLYVVTGDRGSMMPGRRGGYGRMHDRGGPETLVALDAATGTVQWTLALE